MGDSRTKWREHVAAAALLLVFALALFARLLFTNRVLASGDILHYFYPYRDFAADALRAGHIPLWNPFIFNGAPFLANPQAAVLYPLHWPLIWLPATKQIYWSAALHTWLLGLGGYVLMRGWRYGFWSAMTTGVVLAGSGFYGGLIGHINQMNGAAWLPWSVLVLEWATRADVADPARRAWGRRLTATGLLGLLVALMLLAGHTQTVYINLFGLGVWAVWPLVSRATLREPWAQVRAVLPGLGVYAGGVLLGAALSAPQLLPTLELSDLGLRSGGLSYGEASSFSLKPLHLPWTLLPSYGLADLSVVFETLGYTEFVAYVGLIGLGLGVVGAWRGRGRARTFGLLFAAMGFFLAAGRWNPAYFVLFKIVPGFDLFRAPARWMMLYTLGVAVLSGVGMAWLQEAVAAQPRRVRHGFATGLTGALAALLALELLVAARALPHAHPTAPQAIYDLRTAPAHLATDPLRRDLAPGAGGRFLSMSTITFDPGDMADYRRILLESTPPQMDEAAFNELVIALKSQEILAPNLPLLWRIPAVDGFDGGVLPLQRYIRLLPLFVDGSEPVPDGRLREQVTTVPPAHLLDLVNAQYVITDKVRDLWYDDVYYDRQIGARLDSRTQPTLTVPVPLPFEATHIDLIGYVDGPADVLSNVLTALEGDALPLLDARVSNGPDSAAVTLFAGGGEGAQWADGALDSPLAPARADIAFRDVEAGRQEYRARLALDEPTAPDAIELVMRTDEPRAQALNAQELTAVVQAMTLFDARTGMFAALLPSDRGRFQLVHSGDVKVYAYDDVQPRASLAYAWQPAASLDEAAALLSADPRRARAAPVVEPVAGVDMPPSPPAGDGRGTTRIVAYAPERVQVTVQTEAPALLVLRDSVYPGWQATIDGAPAPIHAANVLFRGVFVPAGVHEVRFDFVPSTWATGLWIGLAGLVLTVLLLALGAHRLLSPRSNP